MRTRTSVVAEVVIVSSEKPTISSLVAPTVAGVTASFNKPAPLRDSGEPR